MRENTGLRSLFWTTVSVMATTAVMIMLVVVLTPPASSAETPAERCKRETTAYNTAWKNTWAQTNPGKSPSQAPPPPVPYRCGVPKSAPLPPSTTSPSQEPEPSKQATVPPREPGATGPSLNGPTDRKDQEVGVDPDQQPIEAPPTSPGGLSFVRLPSDPGVLRLQIRRNNVTRTIECTGNVQNVHQSRGNPAWMDVKAKVQCKGDLPIESANYRISYLKKRVLKFRPDQWNEVSESVRTHSFTGPDMYKQKTIMSAEATPCIPGEYQGKVSGYMVIGGAISPNYQLGLGGKTEVTCNF